MRWSNDNPRNFPVVLIDCPTLMWSNRDWRLLSYVNIPLPWPYKLTAIFR